VVSFEYDGGNRVAMENVPSYRYATGIKVSHEVKVSHVLEGNVTGDVAWGGNWFFLVTRIDPHHKSYWPAISFDSSHVSIFDLVAKAIRRALVYHKVTGAGGAEIDHIELCGPPQSPENHSRNFVLCPGGAFDRSPCGTGTSAKLACLYADGKLKVGEVYRQESIIGSVFEGSVRIVDGQIIPRIVGSAYVTGEATLILDPDDPFRLGIRR
jgi:4-hydroxyproline epimerase